MPSSNIGCTLRQYPRLNHILHCLLSSIVCYPQFSAILNWLISSTKGISRAAVLSRNFMQSFVSTCMPSISGATDLLMRVHLGMTPSQSQVGQRGTTPITTSWSDDNELDASVLARIPPEIVRALVRKYLSAIRPHHPFLSADALHRHVDQVGLTLGWQSQDQGNTGPARAGDQQMVVEPSHHFLIVYLVLAIAETVGIANAVHKARCMSLSALLFAKGVSHFSSLSACPSNIT